jgi:peptide/nickel transport system substrate-binding protein
MRRARLLCLAFGLIAPPLVADDTITIATPILPSTVVNPYQGLSLPSIFSTYAVFDPLAVVDGSGRVRPWLAERWESDDAKVWRITLKDDIVFSNGRPLDAAAVVASVAHMQTAAGRAETVGSSLAQIESARENSPRDVTVVLKDRDSMFPTRLALWKLPEPEGWLRARSGQAPTESRGTGPYMFGTVDDHRLALVANPRAAHRSPVGRMVFVALPDQIARMQALLAGSADLSLQLGLENRGPIEAAGGALVMRRTTQLRYVAFAKEHAKAAGSPIQDRRVRRALNYAVNKQAIIDSLLGGSVKPVSQLVFPGAPGHDPSLAPYPFDPDRARALLAEAGHAKGFDLTLRFAGTGSDDATVVQQVIADLRAVGVNVTVRPATQPQMTPLLFNAALEAELFINFARGLDPLGDYRIRSCLGLTAGKPFFCDTDALADIERARNAVTFEDAAEALRAAIAKEYDNPPGIFLWETPAYDGFGPRLPVPSGYGDDYDFVAVDHLRLAANR